MLLQIRPAQFIPPPDFSGLAQLGQGIAQIIDPNRAQRQDVINFLLANPEVGAGLRQQQDIQDQRVESERLAAVEQLVTTVEGEPATVTAQPAAPGEAPGEPPALGAPTPEPITAEAPQPRLKVPPTPDQIAAIQEAIPNINVMEALGFNEERGRQALEMFGPTPETAVKLLALELEERTLRELLRLGTPEQKAAAESLTLLAQQITAETTAVNQRLLDVYLSSLLFGLESDDPRIVSEAARQIESLNNPESRLDAYRFAELALRDRALTIDQQIAAMKAADTQLERDIRLADVRRNLEDSVRRNLEALDSADSAEMREVLGQQLNPQFAEQAALRPGTNLVRILPDSGWFQDPFTVSISPPDPLSLSEREIWIKGISDFGRMGAQGATWEDALARAEEKGMPNLFSLLADKVPGVRPAYLAEAREAFNEGARRAAYPVAGEDRGEPIGTMPAGVPGHVEGQPIYLREYPVVIRQIVDLASGIKDYFVARTRGLDAERLWNSVLTIGDPDKKMGAFERARFIDTVMSAPDLMTRLREQVVDRNVPVEAALRQLMVEYGFIAQQTRTQ